MSHPLLDFLYQHDGHVALLQALLLCAGLFVARKEMIRAWLELGRSTRWGFLGLGVLGMLVPLLVFPTERFVPLGHEASYFECFTGQRSPSNSSGWHTFVTHPLLRWIYWGIGGLVGRDAGPGPLLVVNAAATGAAVTLLAWLARVLSDRVEVGFAAGALLVVHPVHAFWGAAIFHTAIPYTLGVGALLFSLLAWKGGSARLLLCAAACGVTMTALRIEWGVLAPGLAILLLGLGPGWGRHPRVMSRGFWLPALALTFLGGGLVFGVGGSLTQQGGYHSVSGYLGTIQRQFFFRDIFEPWGHGLLLLMGALGGLSWGSRKTVGWRGPAGLWGLVLVTHLALSTFNDYGYRHALLPGTGLLLSAALVAPGLRASFGPYRAASAALLVAAFTTSILVLAEAGDRYYASEEQFVDDHEEFSSGPSLDPAELEDGSCYLISDSERLWELSRERLERGQAGDALVGSHFNLMDPGEAVTHFRAHGGCVLWLLDKSQYRWDSLGARVRAAKMRYWFSWKPMGSVRFDDGLDAVVYRLSSPPWGVGNDQPIPATEFLLPAPPDSQTQSELEFAK